MAETLGMPTLTITIKKAAQTVAARLKDGVVAMIVRDATETPGLYVVGDAADIPSKLAVNTAASVERALLGGINRPQKVLLSVIGASDDVVTKGAAALASSDFDYLAAPDDVDEEEMEALVEWLDGIRAKYSVGKAVLPDHAADNMAVINFSASGIQADGTTYTGAQYCSRIAGLLAGTPLSNSATSAVLSEVAGVDEVADPDAAVAAGKLILVYDGRKTKLGRAVNSMTTVPTDQSESLKKIKIVAAVDLIRREAKMLVDDQYTGQGNSYDSKLVMVAAFQDFLTQLEAEGVLQDGSGYAELNLEKQRAWLKEQGVDVSSMSDQDILKADTGPYIWIKMGGTILDGMEDFDLEFYMGSGTVTGGSAA